MALILKPSRLRSLRHQIGIVPQETTLFSGTVAQNIAYGQTELDYAAIEAAAKVANAHDFISQFSQGYHTWVGERGTNFSGGQRQRIAIARAILLNPRILILDEATSALDPESEALVQEALERAMQNRTVFIIAHRLSTVRQADRILVFREREDFRIGHAPGAASLKAVATPSFILSSLMHQKLCPDRRQKQKKPISPRVGNRRWAISVRWV